MSNANKRLNGIDLRTRAAKLGDQLNTINKKLPVVVTKQLASDDISSSKFTLDLGIEPSAIIAVNVISTAGAYRVVTKVEPNSESDMAIDITATSCAANDVVTVTVI